MNSQVSHQDVLPLLEGAVDTHVHTSPSAFERHDTDFEAARKARDRGMRAIVIKTHHFETASRAMIARKETGFEILGGVTLNQWVGGLNPASVDGAAHFDASMVWMPTITAANHLEKAEVAMFSEEEESVLEGIRILDETGSLKSPVLDVLDRISRHNLVIGCSHLSPEESIELVREGKKRGVEDFLVQHPHANFLHYSPDQMETITDLGATLELTYVTTTEMMGFAATIDDFVRTIERVGPDHVILATDGGAAVNPPPMEMMISFLRELLEAGVDRSTIRQMVQDNPREIFDL